MKPGDPGYADALNEMEAAEAAERTEGKPCGPCPWVSREQRDIDSVANPIIQTQMKMGGWFCCHVNLGTCYGARLTYERHQRKMLTQSERATYQALVARGVSHADAIEDALDGVHVDDVRRRM